MSEYISFNMNEKIEVQLHEKAYEIWYNHYAFPFPNCALSNPTPLEYYKGQADKDGYVSFQAWKFMEIFGEHIRMNAKPFFNPTIRINKSFLK